MRSLSFAEYGHLSGEGRLVPVYREVPADLVTPVAAFRALAGDRDRAFLLESVVGGERVARYSFLGRDPREVLTVRADALRRPQAGTDLLRALRGWMGPGSVPVPGLPRFTGGAVGYLAWDAVRLFEPTVRRTLPPETVLASFAMYRSLVAFDHVRQRLVLMSLAPPGEARAFAAAQEELDALEADLRRPPAAGTRGGTVDLPEGPAFRAGAAFQDAVVAAQVHIAAGDVFQVVLSRREELPSTVDPFDVYRALRMVNPSPYMFFLKEEDRAVAGASPEMLVRVTGARAEVRPIAGTRPRGADDAEDARLEQELRDDPKERAEHVMLVDLGRNDLGRVCRFGSIRVPELLVVERYSHVQHLVSAVAGELREDQDALDALVATFPAGTLSGAPKIRAMQVIDELEAEPRGLYGGALGYLGTAGHLDFCIAIRTVAFADGKATIQAGAGLVADSVPAAEQRETEIKAGAMRAALRLAIELSPPAPETP